MRIVASEGLMIKFSPIENLGGVKIAIKIDPDSLEGAVEPKDCGKFLKEYLEEKQKIYQSFKKVLLGCYPPFLIQSTGDSQGYVFNIKPSKVSSGTSHVDLVKWTIIGFLKANYISNFNVLEKIARTLMNDSRLELHTFLSTDLMIAQMYLIKTAVALVRHVTGWSWLKAVFYQPPLKDISDVLENKQSSYADLIKVTTTVYEQSDSSVRQLFYQRFHPEIEWNQKTEKELKSTTFDALLESSSLKQGYQGYLMSFLSPLLWSFPTEIIKIIVEYLVELYSKPETVTVPQKLSVFSSAPLSTGPTQGSTQGSTQNITLQ